MPQGNYVEILTAVPDIAEATTFYEKLGFKKLTENILTDGSLNIHLKLGDFSSPTLHYMGSARNEEMTSPEGVRLVLSTEKSPVPMPEGTALERKPISRCGKFGEFALSVKNLKESAAYWEKLGFDQLFSHEEPYPWGIFTDGMMVLGLHEHVSFGNDVEEYQPTSPHITYFSADMADRIAAFKSEGIAMTTIPPMVDGVTNAEMTAPGDVRFFLFTGEI